MWYVGKRSDSHGNRSRVWRSGRLEADGMDVDWDLDRATARKGECFSELQFHVVGIRY
jgi:hypothetical protein